jgi:folate-binding protein YgfZ
MTEAERAVRAARESVLAVQMTDLTGVFVNGNDRTSWLNGLVTCDLAKLAPGAAAYGLVLEKKGRIQTDFFAIHARGAEAPATLALAVPRELQGHILETLDHYLIMEDAELVAADLVVWRLVGPRASAAADEVGAPFAGTLALAGLEGAILAAPADAAEATRERIASVVSSSGGAITDEATWEAIRIERGLPRFGVEVDTTLLPQEASLEKLAVSFDKGCYLGQEVVYMLENRGRPKRKLVRLELEGEAPAAKGDPVTTPEGAIVGDVKSSVVGPESKKPVAIAMIKWAQANAGTELRVGERVARVH